MIVSVRIFLSALVLSAALFLSACGGGEELATFKDGNITRGTVRSLFEVMMGPDNESGASVDTQFSVIQNYAYMLLAAREARADGMDKAAELKRVPDMFDEQAALEAFNTILKRDQDSYKFKMAEYQFLWLGRAKPDDQSRRGEADELLGRLNANMSDADVENLITEKTERQRYKILGGYMDPHCVSCVPDRLLFLSGPLKDAPEKKFILVEDPSGFWVVRRLSEKEVPGGALQELFQDYHVKTMRIALRNINALPREQQEEARKRFTMDEKQLETMATNQAQAQLRRELGRAVQVRLENLRKDKKLEITEVAKNGEAKENPADDAVLFTYDGGKYTYGEFKKAMGAGAAADPFSQQLGLLHGLLIPYILFDRFDPEFADAKDSDLAKFLENFRKEEQLARFYFTKKMEAGAEVTEKDIKDWYDLRKESLYKGQSLGAVKNAITQQLQTTRRQELARDIQQKLTEKYELKIFREKLKEGKL